MSCLRICISNTRDDVSSGFHCIHLELLSATDAKDGNGLKLENIGPIFSRFDAQSSKITKIIIMVSST